MFLAFPLIQIDQVHKKGGVRLCLTNEIVCNGLRQENRIINKLVAMEDSIQLRNSVSKR